MKKYALIPLPQAVRRGADRAARQRAASVKLVVFKFAHPAQLKVGSATYNTDAKNQIKLKPEAAWLKENPLMAASERPYEAELDGE